MKIIAEARLRLSTNDLQKALGEFIHFVRNHCEPDVKAEVKLSLITVAANFSTLIARALPADAGDFYADVLPDPRKKLRAGTFLEHIERSRPKKTNCSVTLTEFLPYKMALVLLSQLSEIMPSSGRGIGLMLSVDSSILRGLSSQVRVQLYLERLQLGARQTKSWLRCEFMAISQSDPAAKKTLSQLQDVLGVSWGKVHGEIAPATGEKPSTSEMLLVEHCIQEAFDRATREVDKKASALENLPFLYSRFEAFDQRLQDVQRGKREKIDVIPQLKRFMRESFPLYVFDRVEFDTVLFRKPLSPTLHGVLLIERIHHHGLGKSFTLGYQVEFPGTNFAGPPEHPLVGARNLFSLFHKGWEQQAWAYSSHEDLRQALSGCRTVLGEMLPVLEKHLQGLLSTPPKKLQTGMQVHGRLSAREAHALALPVAKGWAEDAELRDMHSGCALPLREALGPGAALDGRLHSHGYWGICFQSERRSAHLGVIVPHTGEIRWDTFSFKHDPWETLPAKGWLDSTEALPKAQQIIQPLASENEWKPYDYLCTLKWESRSPSAFVWEIHTILYGRNVRDRKDVIVWLDPFDGHVVEVRE